MSRQPPSFRSGTSSTTGNLPSSGVVDRLATLGATGYQRLRRPARGPRRGIALIVVFVTVAILSTSIVEYVYNTRINLHLAQNQRDDVKAYFLARSGVNLQRLALVFQTELATTGGFMGQAMSRSNFQLWQYLDLLLPTFSSGRLSADDLGEIDLTQTGATGFGSLQGSISFDRPMPEEGRLNLNSFASQRLDQEVLRRFCMLLMPPQYDELLGSQQDRAIEGRFEVIAAIIDHIDPDSDRVQVDSNCNVEVTGLGDEGARYRNTNVRPKNEPLVTLDEVRVVPGVTDAFMRQFRDNLTVYPVAGQFYVNLQNAQGFSGFLCSHVQGATEEMNPCTLPVINAQISFLALALEGWVKFFDNPFNVIGMWMGGGGAGGMTPDQLSGALANGQMMAFRRQRDFISVLNTFIGNPQMALYFLSYVDPQRAMMFGYATAAGVPVLPPQFAVQFDENEMLRRIATDTPKIFTVRATGVYGGASRTITAVVDQGKDGRLLYWREF